MTTSFLVEMSHSLFSMTIVSVSFHVFEKLYLSLKWEKNFVNAVFFLFVFLFWKIGAKI